MEKNVEQFMEALEASTKYEEGAADLIHKAGTAIKNFFGTSTGAAQRAAQDAQRNAQTQVTQQKADEINAQNMSSVDLATKINQVITGALKIANKGLNKAAKNEPVTNENATESSEQNAEQNNDSKPVESTNENPDENNNNNNNGNAVNNSEKTQESLTRFLSALYEADASKNQEYYQTAIKNLQDIQNLVKPFLQGQKEFDKKTLKTISDKINDQSIQGVLAKNDKKALKAIQGINTAINGKIKVLQNNNKQQQTQSNNGDNTQQTQGVNTSTDAATTNNSQQQSTEQTQNNSQEQAQNTTADNQQAQNTSQQTQNADAQQNETEQQTQNVDTQAKDPAQMQPEEIKQQPEGQQASKEYSELESAITNLTKKFGSNKAIKTLGNAWETFKSMNSKGGADKILQ